MSVYREFNNFRRKYFPIKHRVSKRYYQDQINIIKKFLRWIDNHSLASSISKIRREYVLGYLSELNRRGLSTHRISFIKKTLNQFFKNAGLNIYFKTTPKKSLTQEERLAQLFFERIRSYTPDDLYERLKVEFYEVLSIVKGRF